MIFKEGAVSLLPADDFAKRLLPNVDGRRVQTPCSWKGSIVTF